MLNKPLRKRWIAGQSGNLKPVTRLIFFLTMLVLALVGVGCTDAIHEKTRDLLPPDSFAQLRLRVDEAGRAEKQADQACAKLRAGLAAGLRGDAISIDVDRAEAAAFEFERRVASARDAAERCRERTRLAGEMQRLERRSRELMGYVQSVRRSGPASTARSSP
jgi:hypothetical protein